ncbi:MAG: hypothetical protein P8Y73_12705 [Desulfuromonadales bacterium]|jgi:hypothetical protein
MNLATAAARNAQALDSYPLVLLFVAAVAIFILFIEAGYRLGSRHQGKHYKAQSTQVRAIMGALLGLIAFMMAFAFATAQNHFETRVANLAEEARVIHNAFLFADYLDEPDRTRARSHLRDYVSLRLLLEQTNDPSRWDEVATHIEQSQNLQRTLWTLSLKQRHMSPNGLTAVRAGSAFGSAVVGIIDIHNARLQAELANRISWVVWVALYFTAMLGMLVMGYHAGMTGRRSPIATYTLAVAFSVVMMLITDLDRPMTSIFDLSDQSLVVLEQNMDLMISAD